MSKEIIPIKDHIRVTQDPATFRQHGALVMKTEIIPYDDRDSDKTLEAITDQVLRLDVVVEELKRVAQTPKPSDEYVALLHQIADVESIRDVIDLCMLVRTELKDIEEEQEQEGVSNE